MQAREAIETDLFDDLERLVRRVLRPIRERRRKAFDLRGAAYAAHYEKKRQFDNLEREAAVVINAKSGDWIAGDNVHDAIEAFRKVHGKAPGYVYPMRRRKKTS